MQPISQEDSLCKIRQVNQIIWAGVMQWRSQTRHLSAIEFVYNNTPAGVTSLPHPGRHKAFTLRITKNVNNSLLSVYLV